MKKEPKIAEWALSKNFDEVMQAVRIRNSYKTSDADKKAFLLPVGRHLLKNPEWFYDKQGRHRLDAQMFLGTAIMDSPNSFDSKTVIAIVRPWLKDHHSSARAEAFLALDAIQAATLEDADKMLGDNHPNNVSHAIGFLTKKKAADAQYADKIEKITLEFNDIRMPTREIAANYWINVFSKEKRAVEVLAKTASTPAYNPFYMDTSSILALEALKAWGFEKEYQAAKREYDRIEKEYEAQRKEDFERPIDD